MAANGISTETVGNPVDPVATKLKRRADKLTLAKFQRQGYVGSVAGSITGYGLNSSGGYVGSNMHNIGTSSPGYNAHNKISGTHTGYVDGQLTTIPGTTSPTAVHPWST